MIHHVFEPNRKGMCKIIVGGEHCGMPKDAQIHTFRSIRPREKRRELIERATISGFTNEQSEFLADLFLMNGVLDA